MADTKHGEIDKSHGALSRARNRLESPRGLNPVPRVVLQPSASSGSPKGLDMGSAGHCECVDWGQREEGGNVTFVCAESSLAVQSRGIRGERDGK